MDNMKFSEMKVGGVYKTIALLQAITEKKAKTGKPFVELELSDGTENVVARKFDCAEADLKSFGVEPETLVYVTFKIDLYNDAKSYNVSDIMDNPFPGENIEDFIIKADINFDDAWELITGAVDGSHMPCEDDAKYEPIKDLTLRLLRDCKESFIHSAAGQSIHHNVIGGLLQHTSEMMFEAMVTATNYQELDRELLLCGTALHDIGKLREMTTSPTGHVEYTDEGRLLGHAAIGIEMINSYAEFGNYNPDRVTLLKHMLAAHHGQRECGAITEPAIPEATVLHAIDMIDSRMYIFQDTYKNIEEGEMSGRIYPLGNCTVYKPIVSKPIVEPEPLPKGIEFTEEPEIPAEDEEDWFDPDEDPDSIW